MENSLYMGTNCPNCGSKNVRTAGSLDSMSGRECWQDCACDDCGAEYVEFYQITHAEVRLPDMDDSERINYGSSVLKEW